MIWIPFKKNFCTKKNVVHTNDFLRLKHLNFFPFQSYFIWWNIKRFYLFKRPILLEDETFKFFAIKATYLIWGAKTTYLISGCQGIRDLRGSPRLSGSSALPGKLSRLFNFRSKKKYIIVWKQLFFVLNSRGKK